MDASLLIIGAGPAGLLAAWTAARRKLPDGVVVLERMPVPGAKLAISGGGRGNLSHRATETEFAAAFGRQGRFTIPAFRSLPPEELQTIFAHIGIPTIMDDTGRFYPRSQSAAQIRDALYAACRQAGVRFVLEHPVENITPPESPESHWQIDSFSARSVLLAAGGQSSPRMGSDGSGFTLARTLGYDLVPPAPALTSLRTVETWPSGHSGVSLPDVTITVAGQRHFSARGEILFTHRGISGPAVLNLSGHVARLLLTERIVSLRLDLIHVLPDFNELRHKAGSTLILTWLARQMPRALAGTLLDLAGIPTNLTFSRLATPQAQNLNDVLTALPLTINGTGGFNDSMATSGGISLKQVHPDTLEGRRTPRLYFAGEILDLDGPTGGWNLQWAFCSGHLAGTRAEI